MSEPHHDIDATKAADLGPVSVLAVMEEAHRIFDARERARRANDLQQLARLLAADPTAPRAQS